MLKTAEIDELVRAIRTVHAGGQYLPPGVLEGTEHKLSPHGLTPRELEVLSLICSGQPSKTIASELGVSLKTVEFHRSNLLKKTDAGSTAHLVQLATRLGFDLGFSPVEIRH